jgi:7tm Chemosensory receptor
MSTPQHFDLIWKIFLFFAVHPLPKPTGDAPSWATQGCLLAWRGFLITVSCLLAFYTYLERESVLYSLDVIGHINDVLKYCSTVATSLMVMLETVVKRSQHVKFWQLVARVHQHGQFGAIEQELNKKYAVKFWVCFSIFVGVEIRVSTGTLAINDAQWFQMWAVNLLPLMVCHLMCLLHIYYIDLLTTYFRFLQQQLEDSVKFSEYSMYVKLDRSVIARRLEALKDVYGLLFEASECVNTIFAWSQALNFTQIFLQSTCDLHWFYKEFEHDFPILVFNFFPSYICLWLLLRAANDCVGMVKSLPPLIYQIRSAYEEAALDRMLRSFAAQLSHEAVSFGGNHLYTIDYGLLRGVRDRVGGCESEVIMLPIFQMTTGIVTYMIIFIQMTPDHEKNHSLE